MIVYILLLNWIQSQICEISKCNYCLLILLRHRQEVSRLETELESVRDRYKVSNDELSSTNDDRVRMTEMIDDLKQQLHKLKQEKDSSLRAAMKQVQALKHYSLALSPFFTLDSIWTITLNLVFFYSNSSAIWSQLEFWLCSTLVADSAYVGQH